MTGSNGNSEIDVTESSTISLSYLLNSKSETFVVTNSNIDIWIPRTSNASSIPTFILMNTFLNDFNSSWTNEENQLFLFSFNVNKVVNLSATLNLKPKNNARLSYLLAVRLGNSPLLNPTSQIYDHFEVFCPSSLKSDSTDTFFYSYVFAMRRSKYISFGIRELTESENLTYCVNGQSTNQAPVLPSSSNNYSTRIVTSFYYRFYTFGCFYLDKSTAKWMSDGIAVQSDSNSTHTHCVSSHLTDFSGSSIQSLSAVLPPSIDFGYAFANASFKKNMTIYLTVVVLTALYLICLVWCIWMDKRDKLKTKIYLMQDNDPLHLYYYEIIVFTGNRKGAGTKSRVSFNLSGSLNETVNRSLIPSSSNDTNKILQRGSINSFVFSTPSSLGQLEHIRIWHDNKGQGGTEASWFLKLIIVHDLQTREQFFFICENWLGLDREDGLIDRLLPVACQKQQTDMKYLIEKQTKEKMSDGHLWFSILARPALSLFTRSDRLTCCFVLLFITMMINILYYGNKTSSSPGDALVIGPLSLSSTQVSQVLFISFIKEIKVRNFFWI